MSIFAEISLIILIATTLAVILRLLKQPLIVGYILAGIVAGPYIFDILHSTEQVELFSKMGITILLFIVGLNLSPRIIKEVGKVSLVTGIGQVLFTSTVGFLIAVFLGISKIAAIYVAIALTFSSTIIILKLLSDKGDLNKLYGRIAIGFLLVQDIVATIILVVVSAVGQAGQTGLGVLIASIIFKALLLAVALYILATKVLPRLSKFLASSQELLFLFSITWGLVLSSVFYLLGFSIEIGALVAGVTLAATPFASEIGSRLRPLRDFFIVLFFIMLGSQMVLEDLSTLMWPALILSFFVLVGNPIIVVILMNLLGYKRRTGFLAGLTVAQISEFSLILAALGMSLGHLSREIMSLVTLVGLITIAGSTYLILYSDKIYPRIEGFLRLLEWRKDTKDPQMSTKVDYSILLFGYDRVGGDFVEAFDKLGKDYLVVDFNPEIVQDMMNREVPYRYGDAEDIEFLQDLNLEKVKLCISTIPDFKTNSFLVRVIREFNKKAIIIVMSSHGAKEAKELYDLGATYVAVPHYLGADHITSLLKKHGFSASKFKREQKKHLKYLKKRYL